MTKFYRNYEVFHYAVSSASSLLVFPEIEYTDFSQKKSTFFLRSIFMLYMDFARWTKNIRGTFLVFLSVYKIIAAELTWALKYFQDILVNISSQLRYSIEIDSYSYQKILYKGTCREIWVIKKFFSCDEKREFVFFVYLLIRNIGVHFIFFTPSHNSHLLVTFFFSSSFFFILHIKKSKKKTKWLNNYFWKWDFKIVLDHYGRLVFLLIFRRIKFFSVGR